MAYNSTSGSDNSSSFSPIIIAQVLSLVEEERPDRQNEKHQCTVPAVLHIAQTRCVRSFPSKRAGNSVGVTTHE